MYGIFFLLLTQKLPLSFVMQEELLMRRHKRDQVVPWRKRTPPFLSPCRVSPSPSPCPATLSLLHFDLCHVACPSRTLAPSHFAFDLYLAPFLDLDLVHERYLPKAELKILKQIKKRKTHQFLYLKRKLIFFLPHPNCFFFCHFSIDDLLSIHIKRGAFIALSNAWDFIWRIFFNKIKLNGKIIILFFSSLLIINTWRIYLQFHYSFEFVSNYCLLFENNMFSDSIDIYN